MTQDTIVTLNTITHNTFGLYFYTIGMDNYYNNNTISNNSLFGICTGWNESLVNVNALYNWWGDESGPYHPTKNPGGKGDNITDIVDFDPWIGKNEPGKGATLYVDDDAPPGGDGSIGHPFNRIQDAINASIDGDTIRVWEGVYYENAVMNKTLSLIGNGSDVTTIDAGGVGSVVKVESDWCNVSGFRLTGCGINYTYRNAAIRISKSDNVEIFENNCSNNEWLGIYLEDSDFCTITRTISSNNKKSGIHFWEAKFCTISNSQCSNNEDNGIFLDGSYNNTIQNNAFSNNQKGIELSYSAGNIVINNTCTKNRAYGVRVWMSNENKLINNSCLDNVDHGIQLHYSDNNILTNNICSRNDVGIYHFLADNNIITNNTCSDNDKGIHLSGSDNNSFSYNILSGNNIGVYLYSKSEQNSAHYNNIFDNVDYGIDAGNKNDHAINASYNWWGHDSGPYHPINNSQGKGDNITDYVLFEPWIGKNEPGKGTTLYVDDDVPPGGDGTIGHPFNRIQDAINASIDGDTVRVWGGEYHENVTVRKSISIIGNGSEFSIIKLFKESVGIFIFTDRVRISGFRITGENISWTTGIRVENSTHCKFENNTISNCRGGIAIIGSSHNSIIKNIVNHNSKYGITLQESKDHKCDNNTINNNICHDNEYGIHLSFTNFTSIENNICYDNEYGIHLSFSNDNLITNNYCSWKGSVDRYH